MVHPSVPCMIITPICPHSLSFRPIVVPAGVEILVRREGEEEEGGGREGEGGRGGGGGGGGREGKEEEAGEGGRIMEIEGKM